MDTCEAAEAPAWFGSSMDRVVSIPELRGALWGKDRVVLVPTMGALHGGHIALLEEARRLAGKEGTVVASIFVNPTQFGAGEDYTSYPRALEDDLAMCREAKTDIVFTPEVGDMYRDDSSTKVLESRLSTHLCGQSRPGHFSGVCTVVLKLFNIVRPEVALFGKKDFQQLAVLRRMVRDLNLEVLVAGVETVREEDGLALSSRNAYLNEDERAQAPVIYQVLREAAIVVEEGERDTRAIEKVVRTRIEKKAPLARIDYLAVVDAEDMHPVKMIGQNALLAVAVYFRKTRLIDNVELDVEFVGDEEAASGLGAGA